jgi:quercetin dioxygenase-like cupin family protein
MANPALTTIEIGRVSLLVYDFAQPGDSLPLHTHDETTAHITVVLRGSFEIVQPGLPPVAARGGDIYEFAAGQPHAINALEADSRLVNQLTG